MKFTIKFLAVVSLLFVALNGCKKEEKSYTKAVSTVPVGTSTTVATTTGGTSTTSGSTDESAR